MIFFILKTSESLEKKTQEKSEIKLNDLVYETISDNKLSVFCQLLETFLFFFLFCIVEPFFLTKASLIFRSWKKENNSEQKKYLLKMFILYIFAIFGVCVGTILLSFWSDKMQLKYQEKFQEKIFDHLQNNSYDYFIEHGENNLIKKANQVFNGIPGLIHFLTSTSFRVFLHFLLLMYYSYNYKIFGLITFLFLLSIFLPLLFVKKINKLAKELKEKDDKLGNFVSENYKNHKVKEFFSLQEESMKEFQKLLSATNKIQSKFDFQKTLAMILGGISIVIYFISFCLVLYWYFNTNFATEQEIFVLISVGWGFVALIWSLGKSVPETLENYSKCDAAIFILNKSQQSFRKNFTEILPKNFDGTISIKNLSLKRDEKTIINNFSADIPKGKTILILGPSGIGKTTLLNILSGIIQNYEGKIFYGKNDLKNLSRKSLTEKTKIITNEVIIG
jgi:ABC-type multidrug transport system fused ATPase/permease subunit